MSTNEVDKDDLKEDKVISPYEQTATNILFMLQIY
tara:strand:+ start:270 stop:374 length:105 start_codon:yes stop_codon:yes gene_type:complete